MLIHNAIGGSKTGETKGPNEQVAREGFRPGDPHNDTGHANFDLLLSTRERPDGTVKFTMAYDTELFRPETIDRLIGHFILLFQRATEDPDIPISELAMSDEEERIDLLERWNGRLVAPETRCVHDVIQQNATVNPQYPALVFAGEMLSYGALENKSNQMARYLIDIGVGPEVLVSVCLNRGIDLIVALLGILKAGGAFVPLDPAYPPDRLRFILRDTSSPVLISTETDFDPSIIDSDMDSRVVDIKSLHLDEFSSEPVKSGVLGRNLAYVIYTSGSSGTPKGVLVEHRNLSNIIRAQVKAFFVHPECRVLQMMSMSFDAAIGEVFRTLTAGATLHLAHRDDLLPGAGLVSILKDNKITTVAMSPTALAAMPDVSDELPDLETITVGGEACSPSVAERWGKNRRILNGYGPTETTIGATLGAEWDLRGKPPLGRPLDGVRVYVLDKKMRPTPVGIPGELYIGGVGVSRGYLNSPDLTEKHFLSNPFSTEPDARIYRTGDLVRWLSNGNLDFLGRIDKQVKIRGFRIELGEIESALVRHPAVDQCAVDVHEYKGVKRLVAFLVFLENEKSGNHELRKFLKDLLPDYMVPAFFIELAAMPMDNSGKIDRKALPEPDVDELIPKTVYVAPVTKLEQQLARLWQDVLGLKQVGVSDNFFELGGDSISAIRVVSRAEEMAFKLAPRDIFLYQSIAELAQFLEETEVTEKHASMA
jgi:amino acid adenylation domain-containing protein